MTHYTFFSGKMVGEVAVLKRQERFIYYLITKERYFDKPTHDDLKSSLSFMKSHSLDCGVSAISMPRIGCGLDGLKWSAVRAVILDVFKDTALKVTVYNYVSPPK